MRLEYAEGVLQRQGHEQYRKRLAELLAADMGIRALPGLSTLPLTILDEEGQNGWIGDVLDSNQPVLLSGEPGSGRRLALIQLIDNWIARNVIGGGVPLPVDLVTLDDGAASPYALLTALIAELGYADAQWRLLVVGWEELSAARRAAWRALLIHGPLPRGARLCIVLAPDAETSWPGLVNLTIPRPSPSDIGRWFTHLAPQARQQILLQSVSPNPTLLRCALAAWQYEQGMLTALRSERERMGQTLVRLYVKRPIELPAAVGIGSDRFYTRRSELHTQAQQIIIAGTYSELVNHPLREDLALLIAEIAPPGDALLRTIFAYGHDDAQLLLLAGHVVSIRPTQSVALTLLVLRALGQLAQTATFFGEQASALLGQCEQILRSTLAEAARRRAFRLVRSVLLTLPRNAALPHLTTYAYAEGIPAHIGWQLTDRLIDIGEIEAPQPDQPAAMARWAFAHALDSDYGHELIVDSEPASILRALATTPPNRREQAAAALLRNSRLPTVVRMSAFALLEHNSAAGSLDLVEEMLTDSAREVRVGAIQFLIRVAPRRALSAAARVARAVAPNPVRGDAIRALITMRGRLTVIALYECTTDQSLGIALRLQALCGLTNRHGSLKRLAAIASDPAMQECLRAIALQLLGQRPVAPRHRSMRSALPMHILLDQNPPAIVAMAACTQLGQLGGTRAIQTLLQTIEATAADPDLAHAAITALGQIGDERAIPTLASLLGATALTRMQQACPEELLRRPTAEVLGPEVRVPIARSRERGSDDASQGRTVLEASTTMSAIPAALAHSLRAAGALCLTIADRPSTLNEYLVLAADAQRRAAAAALALIGGEQAREALTMALIAGECGNALPAICSALARLGGTESASGLADILRHPELSLRARWGVAQELCNHPDAEQAMIAILCDTALDSFTRGAVAEGLGKRRIATAALPLAEIARDQSQDLYLRERALQGLGLLGGTATEVVLRRIAGDLSEPAQIRGLAASQLGATPTDETRQFLRDQLRDQRAEAAVLIGVLQALGRAQDVAMLPLMLEYLLDTRGDVARAAISSVAMLRESSTSSALIALSQDTQAERTSRLYAVGALLKLADRDYSLLLRDYLNSPMLPVQLQALEQLIGADGEVTQFLPFLQDRERAVPFRLRVLEAVAGRIHSAVPLAAMLHDSEEAPELRGRIAQLMVSIGGTTAHNLLAEIALRSGDHTGTRLACIAGLTARRDTETAALLAELVEATDEHPTIREHASFALVQLTTLDGVVA